MKEKFSIALLLILSLAGLGMVYYAVSTIDPEDVRIGDIEESMLGRLVRIEGTIESVKFSKSGNIYLTVADETGKITIPLFGKTAEKFRDLKKGFSANVTGIVSEYDYELEIMPKNENDIRIGDENDNTD